MDPGLLGEELPIILSSLNWLEGTKYLAAVGLVCALWDHLITLDEEVNIMWRRHIDVTKIVFFFHRYGTELGLIYVNYTLNSFRHTLDEHFCKSFAVTQFITVIVMSVSANIYIAVYHYHLWDRRKGAMLAILIALFCTYVPSLVLGILGMRSDFQTATYIPIIDACIIIGDSVEGVAFWGLMVAFDAFAILLAVVNALDRPYREKSDVLTTLRRDGALWFISLFLVRVANFALFITRPPPQKLIIVFFLWAFISITLTRLILRVERLKSASQHVRVWNPLADAFELGRWSNPHSLP